MLAFVRGGLVLAAVCLAAGPALAMPGGNGRGGGPSACDAAALTAGRAVVDAACDCAAATNHGQYVRCAGRAVRDGVRAGTVARACKGVLKSGSARSTCGKVGAVACCRTNESGRTKCSIKSSAAACTPPSGGTACVSSSTTCLDACDAAGCASPSGAFLDGSF